MVSEVPLYVILTTHISIGVVIFDGKPTLWPADILQGNDTRTTDIHHEPGCGRYVKVA